MGTLTPQQTAVVLQGLRAIQQQVRQLQSELDQLLTIFASVPPSVP